ncbi:MAG: hypothetical protein WB809_08690 [Thermoplasmata archaeon]
MTATAATKKPVIALTPGSRVRVRSAGPDESALESVGVFRGLVSIGGDNALALELEGAGEEKGRVRLVPVPALLAVDILEAAKPEEEKRADPSASAAYFR